MTLNELNIDSASNLVIAGEHKKTYVIDVGIRKGVRSPHKKSNRKAVNWE